MSEENKLAEVNATLDRFAKLIEENARQLAEDRKEARRLRAEDLAKAAAEEEKRKAEEEKRKAEELAKDAKRQAEWDKRQAEWDKRQAEWDRRFASICDQVGGQGNTIGEITEAITVSENMLDLLNKFDGIYVEDFYFNARKQYPAQNSEGKTIRKHYEVDGLADGDEVAVVIEAKTVLTEENVRYFLEKLTKFKVAYRDRADKDLYGAMTFIRINSGAYRLAERHGLFLIKASPPDVELANNKGFKPTKLN